MCRIKNCALHKWLKIYYCAVAITVQFNFVLTVSDSSSKFSLPKGKYTLTLNKHFSVLHNETKIYHPLEANDNIKSSHIIKPVNKESFDTKEYGLLDIHENSKDNAQRTYNRRKKREDEKEATEKVTSVNTVSIPIFTN